MSTVLKKKKGLVTSPLSRQLLSVLSEVERQQIRNEFDDIEWVFADKHHLTPSGELDETAQAKMYEKMVEEHNIDVLLSSTNDDNALIHSYLIQRFLWLKGASLESIVITDHKYYTRLLAVPDKYNLLYEVIPLDEVVSVDDIIQNVGLPMILKPACGTNSAMIQICRSKGEVEEKLGLFRRLMYNDTFHNKFGELLMGLAKKHEFLRRPCILAEQFVECTTGSATNHTIEFCIQEGKFIPWINEDNIYWKAQHGLFLGCGTPSLLPTEIQDKALNMAKEIAERMKTFGFNNSMANIEFFKLDDGSLKVMEINGRMFSQMRPVYNHLYSGGDSYRALLDLQLGIPVRKPLKTSELIDGGHDYGLCFYVSVVKGGVAGELFNFDLFHGLLEEEPDIIGKRLLVDNPHRHLVCEAESGVPIAWLYTAGKDFDDCMMKLRPAYRKLLNNQEDWMVWEDDYNIKEMFMVNKPSGKW